MDDFFQFLRDLTNPESIVKLGLPLLLFVVFAETGLLIGFFLPGDSLIFISGLLCATSPELMNVDIFSLILLLSVAAILGNIVGYYFGKKVGKSLFKREDSLFFKRKHLTTTRNFYEKHGGKTLVLGRFLPIIRTFAPILAGVIEVDFKKFMIYNVTGALLWIPSFSGIGYFLGKEFPHIKDYLGYIVIALIVITAIPVYTTYRKEKNSNLKED